MLYIIIRVIYSYEQIKWHNEERTILLNITGIQSDLVAADVSLFLPNPFFLHISYQFFC